MTLSIFSVCLIYDHMHDFLAKGDFPRAPFTTTQYSSSSKSFWFRTYVFYCSTNRVVFIFVYLLSNVKFFRLLVANSTPLLMSALLRRNVLFMKSPLYILKIYYFRVNFCVIWSDSPQDIKKMFDIYNHSIHIIRMRSK